MKDTAKNIDSLNVRRCVQIESNKHVVIIEIE